MDLMGTIFKAIKDTRKRKGGIKGTKHGEKEKR